MTAGGSTRLAAHWIPGSNRGQDHDYMKRARFGLIKVVSTDPDRVKEALAYATSEVIIRRHDISEEQTEMARDPVGTGKRHAAFWRAQFAPGGRLAGLPMHRILVEGINEPSIHNVAEEQIALAYNLAFLEDLRGYGIRGLALNASSGWVRNTDTATIKNTRPIWGIFKPLEPAILAGKHGLGLHEYWRDDPDEGWFTDSQGYRWGWNAHRHWACPLRVPIYIGECGMSKEINGKPAPGQSAGWVGNVSPAVYAEQVWRYVNKLHPNVVAACLFTTDMESEDWRVDDTLQAHEELLKRRTSYIFPSVWPVTPQIPWVETPVDPPDPPTPDKLKLIWPKGLRINSYFTATHSGIDLSMFERTPLYAPTDGRVAMSARDTAANGGYGEYVRIDYHSLLGMHYLIGHMIERAVVTGQYVKKGQLIGYSGNTGNSTGPHAHVEVRLTEDPIGGMTVYRKGVSPFSRGQVDPIAFRAALAHQYGADER